MRQQYYNYFSDEVEIVDLIRIGVLNSHSLLDDNQSNDNNITNLPQLPPLILRKRLEMFLKVLSAVTTPKQLYQHQSLYALYCVLISKTDTSLSKLALDCILTYKNSACITHQDALKNFLDDGKFRSQLTMLDMSVNGGGIDTAHRSEVLPIINRILFSRFSSKSKGGRAAREHNIST